MAAVALVICANTVSAATFSSVFAFYSGHGGACPNGKALLVAPGLIYGTTYYGGDFNYGTVYRLAYQPNGSYTETVLYSFTGGADGGNPTAGLKMDANGAIYGTASTSSGLPNGVIFQLVPGAGGTYTYNVIHAFGGVGDGANPNSDLIFGSKNQTMYGTTVGGGTSGNGTVFSLAPPAGGTGPWVESVIYSFTGGADGAQPYAGLAADSTNNLYGTAYIGGTSNSGTVFELSPPAKGKPTWTETTLYTFLGGADGLNPLAGVSLTGTGTILGNTYLGGTSNDGVIFQLTPPAVAGGAYTETVLINFDGTNGANPSSILVTDLKGDFYGATGGAQAGVGGNVFKLTGTPKAKSPFAYNVLYTFSGGADGQAVLPSVSQTLQGAVFGTTFYGGAGGAGSVFEIQ
jgi:uncharacterized repeat protein (TIGR03803 family)